MSESAQRDGRAATTRNSLLVGGIGLGAALLLILVGALYLNRAVATPLRRTADAAARIAGGDLSERLDTDGPGEVGELERTFNTMAASLERTVADLEERNRKLAESEQVKSELVSNVSHELRTPLASVLGFSSLMLDREVTPEETKRYLEVIRTEARRLAALLNDLLDLERVEQDALELRSDEVDLNELLSTPDHALLSPKRRARAEARSGRCAAHRPRRPRPPRPGRRQPALERDQVFARRRSRRSERDGDRR